MSGERDVDREFERARLPLGVVGKSEKAGLFVGCGEVALLGRRRRFFSLRS